MREGAIAMLINWKLRLSKLQQPQSDIGTETRAKGANFEKKELRNPEVDRQIRRQFGKTIE
jgi:hypothetical protein